MSELDKEFVPYEQALALKELGFDEPCFGYYYTLNGKDWKFAEKSEYYRLDDEINIGGKFSLLAPLYQQASRWFREKHGFFCSPTESDDDITKKYDWHIIKNLGDGKFHIRFIGYKDTYEEAEFACLKKLIEIVKQ